MFIVGVVICVDVVSAYEPSVYYQRCGISGWIELCAGMRDLSLDREIVDYLLGVFLYDEYLGSSSVQQ